MPWEKSYSDAEVLERAMTAFWTHGYEGTSMSDLVEATGINRGSIYAAYAGKRDLFLQVLRHYDKQHRAGFLGRIASEYAPKEAIVRVFSAAAENAGNSGRPGGCLLVNTALELSPHDAEVRQFVDARLKEVEEFFFARIEEAKRDGSIDASLPSRQTAQALLALFLGLRVLTRTSAEPGAIDAITSQASAMLE